MAHNLHTDAITGQTSFFSANGRHGLPWHKIGQAVTEAQNRHDVVKLAHMDWKAEKHQLYSPLDNTLLPDTFGMFRNDTNAFLGAVGAVYTPIQIADALDFVDTLLESIGGAHYESAGLLGNGSRYWVLARVPYQIQIAGTDDKSDMYILFVSSHDGTLSAIGKITAVRVVCNNTLTQAINGVGTASVKIRHSSSGSAKMEQAKKLIGNIRQNVDTLSEKLNILARRRLTPAINTALMAGIFGADWKESTRKTNQIQDIAKLFSSNDNNAFPTQRNTAYNMLNAITEYTDHYRSVRVTSGKSEMSETQVRAEGALFGTGETFKQSALDTILEMTAQCELTPEPAKVFAMPSGIDSIMSSVSF